MSTLRIDEELRSVIPPLSEDEYNTLEASILSEGIREPLVTWGDVIVDGHNRYAIAEKHGLPVKSVDMGFRDKSEAMIWMIDNHRGRRNLSKQAMLDLGFKRAELLKPRAEANMSARKGNQPGATCQESDNLEPVDTLQEAADYAGVSRDTAAKYKRVMSDAPEETKEKVKSGELSINKAYQEIKKPDPKPEPRPEQPEEPEVFWEAEIEEESQEDKENEQPHDARERIREAELGRHQSIVLKTYDLIIQRLGVIGKLSDRKTAALDLAERVKSWAVGIEGEINE